MRILLWYWGRRGGGAQFALGLARALAERADVALRLSVSAQSELLGEFAALGVPLHIQQTYCDRLGFVTSLPRIPAAARALLDEARGVDVTLSAMAHLWTPFVVPRLAKAGQAYVPVVHDAAPHPGDPSFGFDWRLTRELRAARAAVVLSGAVGDALARRAPGLALIRMRLPAMLGGTPTPTLPRFAGEGDTTRFLFFGRLRAYKGLDLLRDAFALLRARHPHARLRVVGEGDAESCAPGLSGLPGVTVEPRWVAEAEIPALLAEADAVVLPYREASQSGVAPQALAMGRPVVATPVGGLAEQLGGGGLLAREVGAEALAEAMARLCDPAELARRSEAAREAGRAASDWGAAAEELLAGLRRVPR